MRRAFTLLEVLVVAAIISLLVAILLPSLQQSRSQARGVACLSNVRQLAIALQMYAQTNGNRLVTGGFTHGGAPGTPEEEARSWFNTLRRSYGNKLVARCPSDQSPYWSEPVPGTAPPRPRRNSYAVNIYITGKLDAWREYNLLGRHRRPSTTISFVELAGDTSYASSDHVHIETYLFNPRVEARNQMAIDQHLQKANYAFLDGHAGRHVFEDTYRVKSISRENGQFVPSWAHNMYDPKVGY
jgi:prepilin-type N-terminal cleavage/methylation domain-containing protein/prepilin-type processing-associated H-X9-DG protein